MKKLMRTLRWVIPMVILVMLLWAGMMLMAAPGDLDSSFGTNGSVITDVAETTYEIISALTFDSVGNIVVAGSGQDDSSNSIIEVTRYSSDGVLDATFGGGDGIAELDIPGIENVSDTALDSQGRIIVNGSVQTQPGQYDYFLARFNGDGTPDTSFSDDAILLTSVVDYDQAGRFVIDHNDRILVTGLSDYDLVLLRYLPDGTLDVNFSGDGIVRFDLNGEAEVGTAVHVLADGKILVSGSQTDGTLLVRFKDNGALDPVFEGGRAYIITDVPGFTNEYLSDFTVDDQNRIVAVGGGFQGGNTDGIVLRYLANGSLDSNFNYDGFVTVDVDLNSGQESFTSVAIDSEGRIVVTGEVYFEWPESYNALMMRLNPDGSPDGSLGGGDGTLIDLLTEAYELVGDGAIDASGRIVIGGAASSINDGFQFWLARLEGGGPLVTPDIVNFISNGSFEESSPAPWKVTIPTGGKIACNKPGKPPIAYQGQCAFRFKGDAAQSSKLVQVIDVSDLNFDLYSNLDLGVKLMSPKASISARAKFKISYRNGSRAKVTGAVRLAPNYTQLFASINTDVQLPKKIKISIYTGSSQTIYVDDATLVINGNTRSSETGMIPLPLPATTNH